MACTIRHYPLPSIVLLDPLKSNHSLNVPYRTLYSIIPNTSKEVYIAVLVILPSSVCFKLSVLKSSIEKHFSVDMCDKQTVSSLVKMLPRRDNTYASQACSSSLFAETWSPIKKRTEGGLLRVISTRFHATRCNKNSKVIWLHHRVQR